MTLAPGRRLALPALAVLPAAWPAAAAAVPVCTPAMDAATGATLRSDGEPDLRGTPGLDLQESRSR